MPAWPLLMGVRWGSGAEHMCCSSGHEANDFTCQLLSTKRLVAKC